MKVLIQYSFADMEISEVMGWIFEVCTINKAAVISCIASGGVCLVCYFEFPLLLLFDINFESCD